MSAVKLKAFVCVLKLCVCRLMKMLRLAVKAPDFCVYFKRSKRSLFGVFLCFRLENYLCSLAFEPLLQSGRGCISNGGLVHSIGCSFVQLNMVCSTCV